MLKRPRLLVLSGRAGSGTTFAARGLSDGLGGRGHAVMNVDGSAKAAELEALVDRSLASAGLGTAGHDLVRVVGRFAGLAGVMAVHDAADCADVIVWDAGEIGGFLRLLTLLNSPSGDLVGMLSPLAAMRAAHALGGEDLTSWRGILGAIDAVRGMVAGEDARILLVAGPDDDVEECLTIRIGQLSLARARCDGIIVNGVPLAADGWPARWAEPRRRRVDALRRRGVSVVAIPYLIDEASGREAFRTAADDAYAVGREPRPLADRVIERADGGYDLRIHLPDVPPGLVRAGRLGDSMVTEVAGLRRQAPLAPVLARCEIEGAGMDGDWLAVRFGRNRALWPETS